MALIIVVSSPDTLGTSVQRSIEFIQAAHEQLDLELIAQIDIHRTAYDAQNYIPYGTVINGRPLILDPGITLFRSRLHSWDYIAYITYPDYNQTEVFHDFCEIFQSYTLDKVCVVTLCQSEVNAGNNTASPVVTAFPVGQFDTELPSYLPDADPLLGPMEVFFTQTVMIPVSYVTLYVTDPETSYHTYEFYGECIQEIQNYTAYSALSIESDAVRTDDLS